MSTLIPTATLRQLFHSLRLSRRATQPPRRLLALDIGSRFVGVAVSDSTGRRAVPLDLIQRRKAVVHKTRGIHATKALPFAQVSGRVKEHLSRYNVAAVVFGYPQDEAGRTGRKHVRQCRHTLEFVSQLRFGGEIEQPFYPQNEFQSSVIAQELADAGHLEVGVATRRLPGESKRSRRGRVDAVAAAVILQSFLDSVVEVGEAEER